MQERTPHLLAVAAALVLPYALGQVDTAMRARPVFTGLVSRLGWVGPLVRGGAREIGGVLAGCGLGQAFAGRGTPGDARRGAAASQRGEVP